MPIANFHTLTLAQFNDQLRALVAKAKAGFKRQLTFIGMLLFFIYAQNVAAHEIKEAELTPRLEKPKTIADNSDEICNKIKHLLLSGEFRKYSVEYTQPEQGRLEYIFEPDENSKANRLQALCGNGSDALCEMTLFSKQGGSFQFSLPATIRVILLGHQIYIINGVTIGAGKEIKTKQYTVHELQTDALLPVCNKF